MNTRKHYLDTHSTGPAVVLAAQAYASAACNEGERVEMVDGHAVTVIGDPPPAAIEAFAAEAARRIVGPGNRRAA